MTTSNIEKDISHLDVSEEILNQPTPAIRENLPLEQVVSTNLSDLHATEDYEDKSIKNIINRLDVADDALITSTLSYCIYDRNLWTITDINKDLTEMTVHIQKAMHDNDALYNLKMWHFNKSFFETIPDSHLGLPSMGIYKSPTYGFVAKYEFKDGQYSAADDLAHACILRSKRHDGGYNLHICFRGTEFTRLPAYIAKAYPDMSAYYENFKPLEQYIMAYAKNPANEIKEIQVSGHSLGGAMVQEFLKNNPANENELPIRGFTFGSPGSRKHFFHKFLTMGYHAVRNFNFVWDDKESSKDIRLNEFFHSNDPVPKLGLLGYRRSGHAHNLFDNVYSEAKKAKIEEQNWAEKIPALGKIVTYFKENFWNSWQVKFHDSKRYTMNLRNLIEKHYRAYPLLAEKFNEKTLYWQDYIFDERKFTSLSIKYRTAFEKMIKDENPTFTSQEINERMLNMREKMRYDSEASVKLSLQGQLKQSFDSHFANRGINALKAAGEDTITFNSTITKEEAALRSAELKGRLASTMEARKTYFKQV